MVYKRGRVWYNDHGELIRNPRAYFRAVIEDRYGFQEEANQKAQRELQEHAETERLVDEAEQQKYSDDEARSKGFSDYNDMIRWVQDGDDLNEQYSRADDVGAPEPPYYDDRNDHRGGSNDDWGNDWD